MDHSDKDNAKECGETRITLEAPALTSEDSMQRHDGQQDGNILVSGISGLETQPQFKLYKRRHAGVIGIIALNIVAAMSLTWFGPIAYKTSQTFGITLDQVNWLGNIIGCTYIVVSPFVPIICSRFGLRISYAIGTGFLVASAWVRFAGTALSLNSRGAYALLIVGQFLSAVPQIIFQILAPKFSETWFDLKGRTTATMLMSVSNPVGTALGQLISPMITDTRTSILILGIISTVVAPFILLVGAKPPTPPSYSGSKPSHHILTTLRAIFGLLPQPLPYNVTRLPEHVRGSEHELDSPVSKASTAEDQPRALNMHSSQSDGSRNGENVESMDTESDADAYMTRRERLDFFILVLAFSVLVSGVITFSILSSQILEPYGYSDDTAGLMGAALLLSGLVAAFVTSPLFDRVFTHHLGLYARVNAPIIAAGWLSLIWAVRPNNTGALYAIFVVIGVLSLSILPVALELGCELTRNSDAASAILWWSANVCSIVFILVMSALRAPSTASPPSNMHRSLIFSGVSTCAGVVFVFFFRGHQKRREKDVRIAAAAAAATAIGNAEGSREEGHARRVKRRLPLRIFRRAEERADTSLR
ncbi:MFS general substrate transporter [Fomitiporia mediterranea MF3/22]|uniref:MFS general substrate transporter n=1 Tax=Fomitiporia mediterranea (strain MF3/22) TaxID=694068 RepID=UPI0004409B67|nr:MFS general substrate transporter [Fomitiporia mediterranea MF3/22]EJC99339.1 MFS general substrate transporter [Fomitiporia mediterranea MF3/22]